MSPHPPSVLCDRALPLLERWSPLPVALAAVILGLKLQRLRRRDLEVRLHRQQLQWIEQAKTQHKEFGDSATQKVAIVTGGSGLSLEIAKSLVQARYFTIIACRCEDQRKEAVREIEAETRIKGMAITMSLNLASLQSVRTFTIAFKMRGFGLDLLVNSGNSEEYPIEETAEGYETHFGVNHLGPFMLTLELLPLLHRSCQGRVLVLTSGARFSSDGIRHDRIFRSSNSYSRLGCYSHSKLANILFVKTLHRRLEEVQSRVTINAVCSGMCNTQLMSSIPWLKRLSSLVPKVLSRSLREGAMTPTYFALSPEVACVSGEYFSGLAPKPVSRIALDEVEQEQLWDLSVRCTGLDIGL